MVCQSLLAPSLSSAVLPDWEWWGNNYVLAHFDNDPAQEVPELAKLSDPYLRHKVCCVAQVLLIQLC